MSPQLEPGATQPAESPAATGTAGKKPARARFTTLLESGFKWGGYALTALSVIWSVLLLFIAKDELSLLAWVREDRQVYPSDATWGRSLPLTFDGNRVRSVRVVSVRIMNYGKATIGSQDATWLLTLEAPHAEFIRAIDEPDRSPATIVSKRKDSARPNMLTLEIGALQPRAHLDARLMLINSQEGGAPLRMDASLAGLPRELSDRSPVDRLFERLTIPVLLSCLLLMAVIDGPSLYKRALLKYGGSGPRAVIDLSWRVLLVGAVAGVFLAKGLAYAISWFL